MRINIKAMDLKEVKERMRSGRLYYPTGEDLLQEQAKYMEILYDFNQTRPREGEKRAQLLESCWAAWGKTATWSRLSMPIGAAIPTWEMRYTPTSI